MSAWQLLQPIRFAALLAAVLGTGVLGACAGKRPAAVVPRPVEKIAGRVTNHHFLDVVVYAICEGQRSLLNSCSRVSWRGPA